ncbi:hypothetical protein EB230_17475 [Mesorhizobium sp. NZP2234]|uniref:hypothetical protein n=1 Tax=Mesorhizobium sp. NZP2234 TaxID=2483402 RepID=UPI001554EB15|nr:hypothetical protein [Mesorhizobium sp. NZP2234]QKC89998.1 hypothetical protein EB230_17475 [Mesorhizobium sp. NZP2234]
MAPHPRKIIRAAVAALLATPDAADPPVFPTAAKARFYNSRDFPADARTMPVGVVYTGKDLIDPDYRHDGGIRRRFLKLIVECYAVGDEGADAVDDCAFQVETWLHANPTLGNLVEWCTIFETDTAFAEQGEVALWTAILTFDIIYYTQLIEVDGRPPTTVLLGFDPETGPGNEPLYTDVTALI